MTPLTTTPLTATAAWQALAAHHAQIKDIYLRRLFAEARDVSKMLDAMFAGEMDCGGIAKFIESRGARSLPTVCSQTCGAGMVATGKPHVQSSCIMAALSVSERPRFPGR